MILLMLSLLPVLISWSFSLGLGSSALFSSGFGFGFPFVCFWKKSSLFLNAASLLLLRSDRRGPLSDSLPLCFLVSYWLMTFLMLSLLPVVISLSFALGSSPFFSSAFGGFFPFVCF